MPVQRNIPIGKSQSKSVFIDVFVPDKGSNFETVVFFHGTKGFKDWGPWPHMYYFFNHAGLALVTVNFSHNGIGGESNNEFTDTNAYSENTISLELAEMKMVLDWLEKNAADWNLRGDIFHICGHSRAGGEVIIFGNKDVRVDKIIAWAPITDFLAIYSAYDRSDWKKNGFIEVLNTRTGQQLPVKYSFVSDIEKNAAELNIIAAAAAMEKPLLLIHGEMDEAVSVQESEKIYEICLHSLLLKIAGTGHTFGTSHPWPAEKNFPSAFLEVLDNSVEFITG